MRTLFEAIQDNDKTVVDKTYPSAVQVILTYVSCLTAQEK